MAVRDRNMNKLTRRLGFTLIELAIVLGILGALTGTIFATANSVQRQNMVNQASDELAEAALGIRGYYTGIPVPTGLAACPPDFTTLITNKVYPKEMLATGAVNNPWNINSTTDTVKAAICKGAATEFVIRYIGISREACADMLVRNSLPGHDTGLIEVDVADGTVASPTPAMIGKVSAVATATPLPITPVDAATACGAASSTIDWYYNLNN